MTLETVPNPEGGKQAAMRAELEKAIARLPECSDVLILMQKKEGGLFYLGPDSMMFERMVFMATSFLHGIMAATSK